MNKDSDSIFTCLTWIILIPLAIGGIELMEDVFRLPKFSLIQLILFWPITFVHTVLIMFSLLGFVASFVGLFIQGLPSFGTFIVTSLCLGILLWLAHNLSDSLNFSNGEIVVYYGIPACLFCVNHIWEAMKRKKEGN